VEKRNTLNRKFPPSVITIAFAHRECYIFFEKTVIFSFEIAKNLNSTGIKIQLAIEGTTAGTGAGSGFPPVFVCPMCQV
jgi:hypothetical protein